MSLKSIREALTRYGPMTTEQIGARAGIGPSSVCTQIKSLRENQEVHITGWIMFKGTGPGRSTPIYTLGSGQNVPCPVRGKLAKAKANREPKPVKVCDRAEIRRQAGMWGGLVCSA